MTTEECQLLNDSASHRTNEAAPGPEVRPPASGEVGKATTDLTTELIFAEREINRLRLRVDELKQSLSYRIAAPIRILERGFRSWRKRSLLRNIHKAIHAQRNRRSLDWRFAFRSDPDRYGEWISVYDSPSDAAREAVRDDLARWPRLPLVSIMIDARECLHPELQPTIQSLSEQLYPEIEVIIACRDEPQARAFEAKFDEFQVSNRIRWIISGVEQATSAVAVRLLADAKGELGLSAPPGIRLSSTGLYLIIAEWLSHPGAAFVYPDEDATDSEGKRCYPFFKPDWSRELSYAIDLAGPGTVFDLAKVRAVGGVDRHAGEVWRWNLTLRLAEHFGRQAAHHLPFVTIHVPMAPQSNSAGISDAEKMLSSHLSRLGAGAEVEVSASSHIKIKYSIPAPAPPVCAIVPTRDKVEVLRRCVSGLLHQTDYPDLKVMVVDNGSAEPATHEYFRLLKLDRRVEILSYPGPFNFAAIHNRAVRAASGEILALINNDIEIIHTSWLREMVSLAIRPSTGVVGAKLLYPNERIQHAGVVMGFGRGAGHIYQGLPRFSPAQYPLLELVQNVSAVTGACMVLRRSIYEEVGGMDETFAVNFNDVDLCLRIADEGYDIVWTPHAELYHRESFTRESNPEGFQRELELFRRRWKSRVDVDPFYNPNLTLETPYRELAFPPRVQPPWRHKAADR